MSDPGDPTEPMPAARPPGPPPPSSEPPGSPPPSSEAVEPEDGGGGNRRLVMAVVALVVLALIGVLFFVLAGGDDDEDVVVDDVEEEIEDDVATAVGAFELGETYTNTIAFEDGPVAHSTAVEGGSVLTIETALDAGAGGVSYVATIDGEPLTSTIVQPGQEDVQQFVLGSESGGDLQLEFTGDGTYTFMVTEDSQDDGGTGGDAGDDLASASTASTGTLDGVIGGSDPADFYAIDVPAGALLDMTLVNDATSEGRIRLEVLYNGERIELVDVQPGGEESISRVVAADAAGEYVFAVTGGGERNDYVLSVSTQAQSDGGGSGDAPGELGSARGITVGEELSGRLGDDDVADFYRFDAPGGSAISVPVANDPSSATRLRAELFFNGERIDFVDVQPGGEGAIDHLASAAQEGEYALGFTAGSGGAIYDFTASVEAQDDAGQEGDAPDDAAEPRRVEPGQELAGRLGDADRVDHYVVAAPAPTATVEVTSAAESGQRLRAEALVNGDVVGFVDVQPGTSGSIDLTQLPTAGDVVLRFSTGAQGASYTFTVS